MKCIILTAFLLISFTLAAQQNLVPWRKYFSGELKPWVAAFQHFWLRDFKKLQTLKFDNLSTHNFSELKTFYKTYKPILSFTKDSTKFIDIYSYDLDLEKRGKFYYANIAGEQEIDLCMIAERYWKRIAFYGISQQIVEAGWIDATRFMLAGISMIENEKGKPFIIIGSTSSQTLDYFENTNKLCFLKTGYHSKKLNRIMIKDL